ncbi:reverse transcriptase zinc-binding domain-containing protein [Tanacetum coccineum]
MVRGALYSEIRSAMFLIGNDKAPGLDGFTLIFFKKAWDVVGVEVCNAVRDFFTNGKLLQDINHTILALLPKCGLRQGDPMSPYLFMLVMEILTLILKRRVHDLIVFSHGDVISAKVIMDSLEEFKGVSGLVPSNMKHGNAKVSWEDVCLCKQEGGHGIRRLENFNVALMSTHVWKIVTRKESLWVKWIHAYKLKKRSFWDVKMASIEEVSICKNVLMILFLMEYGRGQVDKLQWKAYDGSLKDFSCREVWFMIQEHGSKTEWYYLVWSPYGIPRHAIHLWLVMKKRLKMKDRLTQWDVGNDVDLSLLRCPLCKSQQDSHEHLFFECSYSSSIWQNVLNVVGISGVSSQWDDIMLWLLPISKSKNVISIIGRLIVAATAYFL